MKPEGVAPAVAPAGATPLISVRGLAKEYVRDWRGTRQVALDGVDLTVARGRICALVGPNGSGKTTLLKILAGFTEPTRGNCAIAAGAGRIGYVADDVLFPGQFTVRELLRRLGELYDLPQERLTAEIDAALRATGLESVADRRVGELSKGTRQRVGLAQALLGDPELLLLDEPAAALDPRALERLTAVLVAQRAAGRTVVLSSHFLPQIEAVADDFLLLERGRVLFQGDRAAVAARGGLEAVYLAEVQA